ncbi:MAG: hypothetical protein AAFP10_05980 [Pseudomonadota bacterium]
MKISLLIFILVFSVTHTFFAQQEFKSYPGVALTGNIWANGQRTSIKGRSIICGLGEKSTYLSLRTMPNGEELLKLNNMMILEITGNVSNDKMWAEISEVIIELKYNGSLYNKDEQRAFKISGWVHTDYLCNYFY